MPKTILVAGALGIIGRALIEHCEDQPDLQLIGLARRTPEFKTRATFRAVDLLDRVDCERKLSELREVTHIVYAAWQPRPWWSCWGWRDGCWCVRCVRRSIGPGMEWNGWWWSAATGWPA